MVIFQYKMLSSPFFEVSGNRSSTFSFMSSHSLKWRQILHHLYSFVTLIDKLHNLNDLCNIRLLERVHITKHLNLFFFLPEANNLSLSLLDNLRDIEMSSQLQIPFFNNLFNWVKWFIKYFVHSRMFTDIYYILSTVPEIWNISKAK